jgi:hypothetical protein
MLEVRLGVKKIRWSVESMASLELALIGVKRGPVPFNDVAE